MNKIQFNYHPQKQERIRRYKCKILLEKIDSEIDYVLLRANFCAEISRRR